MERLTSTDASTISASAERVPAEIVRRLCADYDFALRELARWWNRILRLDAQLRYHRAQIGSFVEVCPEPDDL
jgi:hypothetical protein